MIRQERVIDDVTIVLVGKYTDLHDSYMSVTKSLEHSAFRCNRRLILKVRPTQHQFPLSIHSLTPASGSTPLTSSRRRKRQIQQNTTTRGALSSPRGGHLPAHTRNEQTLTDDARAEESSSLAGSAYAGRRA